MSSRFSGVVAGPPIEVFAVNKAYLDDTHPNKVNLSIGAYRTDEGKPWVLPIVRKVELQLAQDESLNHEYLPVLGLDDLSSAATKMLLGNDHPAIKENRAFGVQGLSGTGDLRVGAEMLCKVLGFKTYCISRPTWENHRLVFNNAGFETCLEYRYWDAANRKFDLDGMLEDLRSFPEGSVVILHSCAHNPTGMDPTEDQWKQIAAVMKEKKLFTFFDAAYQGFASGDLDKDAWAVRYFASEGFEFVCAQSFAKNFGLYNERIGNLTIVMNDPKPVANLKTQITLIIRAMYSNPPSHGARIVATVLNDPVLYEEWRGCIKIMSSRIKEMRQALRSKLEELGTPGTWNHITQQIGLFSYVGLTPTQVEFLSKECHIYMLSSGRANMCGLNTKNVDYVAHCIHRAITGNKL